MISWLTEELVRRGHEVTLFASGDSVTQARLVPICERALRLDPRVRKDFPYVMIELERVIELADQFDLIHWHIDYWSYPIARRLAVPQVTTLHGRLDIPDLVPLYREFREIPVVSISDAQREPIPWANWQATIYHGLPEDLLTFRAKRGDYLAFLGRVSPEKGIEQSIEIAGQAGMNLKVAAKVGKADQDYYHQVVKPQLEQPFVDFIGEIDENQKNDFLGNAYAVLFPANWPEPFGLVIIEAMACGTPVIAFRNGAVPEVMEEGTSGFVVETVEEAVRALGRVPTLSRRACRAYFEKRFTASRMARDYLALYRHIVESWTEPNRV